MVKCVNHLVQMILTLHDPPYGRKNKTKTPLDMFKNISFECVINKCPSKKKGSIFGSSFRKTHIRFNQSNLSLEDDFV